MLSIRLNSVSPTAVENLHAYYLSVLNQYIQSRSAARFSTALGPLANKIRKPLARFLGVHVSERGNCARWTSKGLVAAGLMRRARMYPK
ncbi:hypothetical protein HK102_006951, partial [Quaeritorhiza haematococci]